MPIELEVTLENALSEATDVFFSIEEPDRDAAKREVDYVASFSALTIDPEETTGTATLTLEVKNNTQTSRAKTFTVVASIGEETATARGIITITDDDSPTTEIKLSAEPAEVTMGAGETDIVITGEINGDTSEEDRIVTLVLAAKGAEGTGATAERDIDFDAALTTLTILGGEIKGTATVSQSPH